MSKNTKFLLTLIFLQSTRVFFIRYKVCDACNWCKENLVGEFRSSCYPNHSQFWKKNHRKIHLGSIFGAIVEWVFLSEIKISQKAFFLILYIFLETYLISHFKLLFFFYKKIHLDLGIMFFLMFFFNIFFNFFIFPISWVMVNQKRIFLTK